MKKKYTYILLLLTSISIAQSGAPAMPYYSGMDWTQTGATLKTALASKTITKHTNLLSYSDAEKSILITDLDPSDITNTNLLLLYGFSNNLCPSNSTDDKDHRLRNKTMEDVGTSIPCVWNREHTYPKALGVPNLGTSGPGSDSHHLRAADKKRNADRDNDKFFNGSGNSYETGLNWYPGDEWKGDVARMMMYMYLRYDTQCLPTGVGIGTINATDPNMIDLFLQWNADDPVSQYEDNRNNYHGNTANSFAQGNRNPFIDNPYLATRIWGGPVAENRWPTTILANDTFDFFAGLSLYPNPTNDHTININTSITLDQIEILNLNGQTVKIIQNPIFTTNIYTIESVPQGLYLIKITSENQTITKKLIVN